MSLIRITPEESERLSPDQLSQLHRNASLLATGKGSDCTITCEGNTVKVHREIISARSKFFADAFNPEFKEISPGVLHLVEHDVLNLDEAVTNSILWRILEYIYLSFPDAGIGMEVYGHQSDAYFFEFLLFDLYRQADYLQVSGMTEVIIKELKECLRRSASTLSAMRKMPFASLDAVFQDAYKIPMMSAVFAYDKSNQYYDTYELVRTELFCWITDCYPVLCRLGDDFDDYLRAAPELGVAILKAMRPMKTSQFIQPPPEARCMFCGDHAWKIDYGTLSDQLTFGVVANRSGRIQHFCSLSTCFRQMTLKKCFGVD